MLLNFTLYVHIDWLLHIILGWRQSLMDITSYVVIASPSTFHERDIFNQG